MHKVKAVGLCVALVAASAAAQTNTFPTSGSVGIGTTSPGSPLDVRSGTSPIASLYGTTGGNQSVEVGNSVTHMNLGVGAIGSTAGVPYIWSASGNFFIGNDGQPSLFVQGMGYGNVGIGMASPQAKLDVAGVINGRNFTIPNSGSGSSWAKIGTFTATQNGESIRITAVIHSGYNASNGQDSTYFISFKTSNANAVDGNGFAGNGSYYAIGFNNSISPGSIKWVANAPGINASSFDLYIYLPAWTNNSHYAVTLDQYASWINAGAFVPSDPGAASNTILIPNAEFDLPYGNVGIGTTTPAAKLEVNGNVKLTSGSGASITFADGTTQSTAWSGTLCGGDYAESVDVTGDRTRYEPGDVLVVDASAPGKFLKSNESYSTGVTGIYSTKPGVIGRRQTVVASEATSEVPMAMIGIVPVKVSAENGPIKPGDFLVTASITGYAMRGTDRNRMFGAVVGKALGSLDSGTGIIETVVSLQ